MEAGVAGALSGGRGRRRFRPAGGSVGVGGEGRQRAGGDGDGLGGRGACGCAERGGCACAERDGCVDRDAWVARARVGSRGARRLRRVGARSRALPTRADRAARAYSRGAWRLRHIGARRRFDPPRARPLRA
ncbi:hypothetical protein GCM10010233_10910 [Streptomyces pseudogriseolus]|nr:hypothetical protein GCM10010233_10910 [Streptomyces gancidicus]